MGGYADRYPNIGDRRVRALVFHRDGVTALLAYRQRVAGVNDGQVRPRRRQHLNAQAGLRLGVLVGRYPGLVADRAGGNAAQGYRYRGRFVDGQVADVPGNDSAVPGAVVAVADISHALREGVGDGYAGQRSLAAVGGGDGVSPLAADIHRRAAGLDQTQLRRHRPGQGFDPHGLIPIRYLADILNQARRLGVGADGKAGRGPGRQRRNRPQQVAVLVRAGRRLAGRDRQAIGNQVHYAHIGGYAIAVVGNGDGVGQGFAQDYRIQVDRLGHADIGRHYPGNGAGAGRGPLVGSGRHRVGLIAGRAGRGADAESLGRPGVQPVDIPPHRQGRPGTGPRRRRQRYPFRQGVGNDHIGQRPLPVVGQGDVVGHRAVQVNLGRSRLGQRQRAGDDGGRGLPRPGKALLGDGRSPVDLIADHRRRQGHRNPHRISRFQVAQVPGGRGRGGAGRRRIRTDQTQAGGQVVGQGNAGGYAVAGVGNGDRVIGLFQQAQIARPLLVDFQRRSPPLLG